MQFRLYLHLASVLIDVKQELGTRGCFIVVETQHLVVEPFYYNHYSLWSEVVNLAADSLVRR